MKKILGTLLILTNIVIFSGCILNEDEKFNPVALKIESTDLTQTTRDEYTIPAGGGQLTVYSTEEKNPFCNFWRQLVRSKRYRMLSGQRRK